MKREKCGRREPFPDLCRRNVSRQRFGGKMEQYANRKAAAQIRVVDEKGNAVKNSEFQAELTNHDFLFGCGAFDALSLMDEEKNDAF